MTVRKRVVERYIEGFRAGDHELILDCLTDDVAWEMPPYFALGGRAAFDDAIENDATPGLPDIQLTRLIEEGDIVVAEGAVQVALKAGGRIDALFCDVFHFRDDKICRLTNLPGRQERGRVAPPARLASKTPGRGDVRFETRAAAQRVLTGVRGRA